MRRLMQAGILLCLMVMAGCAKDENLLDNENLSQNLSSEMKLVKDKFDKQYYTGLQTRTSSEEFRSMFIDLKPDWENAIEEENDDEKVILVPIRVKGIEININYECSQRYNETKDERYLNTRMLLCFKVNKKTKKEDFFFMSFAPSESYLVKNNFDLTNNFYFKRDKNYDGKVIYHDINSNFVNGWEYQKGKITAFEYPKLNNKSAVTTRSNSEEIVCYESWRVTVTTYYYSVNGGPLHYNFSRVESSSDQFCVFANPTGNRPAIWWIDDSDGSGKGGGGYTPPAPPEEPEKTILQKIANTINLDNTQKQLLNKAMEELINEGCMQKALYQMLVNKNVKLDFGMVLNVTDKTSPANYNPYNKSINFKNNESINSENLKEEVFHAWQDAFYSGGISQYGKDPKGNKLPGYVNIEFEAKFFRDIILSSDWICCTGIGSTFSDELNRQYSDCIYSIRDSNLSYNESDYQKWLVEFQKYSTAYTSPIINNLSTPSAINNLKLNSDCNH